MGPHKIQSARLRIFRKSVCWVYPRLQILLCVLYKTLYRAYRGLGDFLRYKTMENNQEPRKIQG